MNLLGIDIGGSGIKGALVNPSTGELSSSRERIATPPGAKPKDVANVVSELTARFGHTGPIGVTFPGIVQGGRTLSAANVDSDWIGQDAQALFSAATGQPCRVLNDADAAGLAESRFGAARDVAGTALLLTLGTGIGSALLDGGRLVPNTELGHLWLPNGKHAESWASARTREEKKLGWKKWSGRLQIYLEYLEALFSPEVIVLGGGISKDAEKWLPLLHLERTRLETAALLNNAGIVGAALYAAQEEASAKPAPKKPTRSSKSPRS